jgi:hypothetical protein
LAEAALAADGAVVSELPGLARLRVALLAVAILRAAEAALLAWAGAALAELLALDVATVSGGTPSLAAAGCKTALSEAQVARALAVSVLLSARYGLALLARELLRVAAAVPVALARIALRAEPLLLSVRLLPEALLRLLTRAERGLALLTAGAGLAPRLLTGAMLAVLACTGLARLSGLTRAGLTRSGLPAALPPLLIALAHAAGGLSTAGAGAALAVTLALAAAAR